MEAADAMFLAEEGFVGVSGRTGFVLHDPVYGEQQYVGRSTWETSELPLFCWRTCNGPRQQVFIQDAGIREAYARLKAAVPAVLKGLLRPTDEDLALLKERGFLEATPRCWETDEEEAYLFFDNGWVFTRQGAYVKDTEIRYPSVREALLYWNTRSRLDRQELRMFRHMEECGLELERDVICRRSKRYVGFYIPGDVPPFSILNLDLLTLKGRYTFYEKVGGRARKGGKAESGTLDMSLPESWGWFAERMKKANFRNPRFPVLHLI